MDYDAIDLDPDLLRRFDRNGPRYTSYPTADRFSGAFDAAAYRRCVEQRSPGGVERPLSLYVHLPFCRDICYYCACNKIVTRDAGKARSYLEYLGREIGLQAGLLDSGRRVTQMHWGGGTPTYYDVAALSSLFARLAAAFELSPRGEYSIEVDPRTADAAAVAALRKVGFNRISFGVQDFDAGVQAAIRRRQSVEQTQAAVEAARRARFHSVSIDLVYGLPLQTAASFAATLEQVVALRPDRVAVYGYAHLPRAFKAQRAIRDGDLPPPALRLQLLSSAVRRLREAGYVHLGMDHFALPQDALVVAQAQGRMHRNFQGYSTMAQTDLVGLGVSAIGAVGPTYSQNHRGLAEYCGALDRGELPIARGIELGPDDVLRRAVIQALMCHMAVSKRWLEVVYLVDFDRYFAAELETLRELEGLGIVRLSEDWIEVSPKGRFLIRNVCMVFDCYQRPAGDGPRHSRMV